MQHTKIEWTATVMPDGSVRPGHTWNPWRGCAHATLPDGTDHPGCHNCYAEAMATRNPKTLGTWGGDGTRIVAANATFMAPLKWNERAKANGVRERVFVNSMSDFFEEWNGPIMTHKGEEVADFGTMKHLRAAIYNLIDKCDWLDFLILTKRPQNIRRMWPRIGFPDAGVPGTLGRMQYLENVWLLTSVSDQQTLYEMVPHLLGCRDLVPVLGASVEPLLGNIIFERYMIGKSAACRCPRSLHEIGPAGSREPGYETHPRCPECGRDRPIEEGLDWIIVGGESGHQARPIHPAWVRSIRDQCKDAGVPFFFKQWGEWYPFEKIEDVPEGASDNAPVCLIKRDGRVFRPYSHAEHAPGQQMVRVGKKAAGRLLDGVEYSEFPEANHAART